MFQMELEGVTAPGPEDRVIERDGAKVYIHPFTAVGRLSKNLYLLALATGRQQLRCRVFVNVQLNEDSWVTSLLHCIKILILCS